jgi:hypothetical protein
MINVAMPTLKLESNHPRIEHGYPTLEPTPREGW